VRHIFGVPGDTTVPFYDALYDAQADIQHILARDERSAAFMADAYARVSFKPGVCEGPSGGGATFMLPGVAEACGSSVPVIALTSDNALSFEEKGALTALDQRSLFKPVTKWNVLVKRADMIPGLVRRAFRMATSGRPGAVHLALPKDVLEEELQGTTAYAEAQCASYPAYRSQADASALRRAAELLLEARQGVIVAGGGAVLSGAWEALTSLADTLAMPVGTTINGKGSVAEDHPLSIGVVGGNGGRAYANRIVQEADLVFYVGSKVNYVDSANWTVPNRERPPKIIQLDIDAAELGNNYPISVGLCGDARLTLENLCELLKHEARPKGERVQDIARRAAGWWAQVDSKAESDAVPVRPQRVIWELQDALPPDSIVVADPGTPTPFVAAQFKVREPGRKVLIPRAHGALGYAIPGVVGAKVARPHACVVGLCGDGSFAMSAGDLASVKRLGEPLVLINFNNGCYGWIKMLQKLHYGGRYFSVDFDEGIDYAAVAQGFGLRCFRVQHAEELRGAIREALNAAEPAFVDVPTAYEGEEVPPVDSWWRTIEQS
jgi:acetolactate synthase-1/2/3 large subunit